MLGITLDVDAYVDRLQTELAKVDAEAVKRWSDAVFRAWQDQRFVFVIGNGGSGTTASHMAEDLGKSSVPDDRLRDPDFKRLKILSLTDNAGWIMAVGNDLSYDQIFVQQLMNYGSAGDVLLAISGSGNSPNIMAAVDWAKQHGLHVFALTGYDGGQLKQQADDGLHIELDDIGMVESIHLALFHWVLNDVHARINEAGRYASDSASSLA